MSQATGIFIELFLKGGYIKKFVISTSCCLSLFPFKSLYSYSVQHTLPPPFSINKHRNSLRLMILKAGYENFVMTLARHDKRIVVFFVACWYGEKSGGKSWGQDESARVSSRNWLRAFHAVAISWWVMGCCHHGNYNGTLLYWNSFMCHWF